MDLDTLRERAAQGELDPADAAAFSAEVAAVALDRVRNSTDPDTATARAYLVRCQVADAQDRVTSLLAEADMIEHDAQLANAVMVAQARLQAARQVAAQAHELAGHRAQGAQLAADKSSTASEYAAKMRKASEDLALLGADPEQQTTAMLRRDAAADIDRRAAESAEWAAQAHQAAVQDAGQADALARDAQAALEAAEDAHANAADTVRPSPFSLGVDWVRLLARTDLTSEELGVIRGFVASYAWQLGADEEIRSKARADALAEAREEAYKQLVRLPTAGERLDHAANRIHHSGNGGPFADW